MVLNVYSQRWWWQRWGQRWSPLVLVFIHSSAIVFIAPKATNNVSLTIIVSCNTNAVPSVGFQYYINYHHKDDVMIWRRYLLLTEQSSPCCLPWMTNQTMGGGRQLSRKTNVKLFFSSEKASRNMPIYRQVLNITCSFING